jgi:hypothetical protein
MAGTAALVDARRRRTRSIIPCSGLLLRLPGSAMCVVWVCGYAVWFSMELRVCGTIQATEPTSIYTAGPAGGSSRAMRTTARGPERRCTVQTRPSTHRNASVRQAATRCVPTLIREVTPLTVCNNLQSGRVFLHSVIL